MKSNSLYRPFLREHRPSALHRKPKNNEELHIDETQKVEQMPLPFEIRIVYRMFPGQTKKSNKKTDYCRKK